MSVISPPSTPWLVSPEACRRLGAIQYPRQLPAPGITKSEMIANFSVVDPAQYARMCSNIPMGRVAEPVEQAKALLFLAFGRRKLYYRAGHDCGRRSDECHLITCSAHDRLLDPCMSAPAEELIIDIGADCLSAMQTSPHADR